MSEARRSKYIEAGSFTEKEHVIHDEQLLDHIAKLEHKLVLHGHCPKCDGVYSRKPGVGCLKCGWKEKESE